MKFGAVENKARIVIVVLVAALVVMMGLSLLLFIQSGGQIANSALLYLFSYQVIALIVGVGLVLILVRLLLRPYRRMVRAAQESPVRASSAKTESEFVVETFQALIEQLQTKEKELANLHALERRRAERSERVSERLIANIPSGMVIVDQQGQITSINAHTMKIFGAAETGSLLNLEDEAEGGLIRVNASYQTFFKSSPAVIEMIAECLNSSKTFRRQEADVNLSDGRVRRLGLSISPISDGVHGNEGALCLMTDITEVIELRERMKLKENLASLGEMAAGLAHEFKNSLATIQGYVQLLEAQLSRPSSNEDHKVTLGAALNEVRLLARLVTDFLNFARPQQLSLTSIDLRAMIDDCSNELKALVEKGGIELVIEGEFGEIAGDEPLLRRVFLNLLRNAMEAIDSQSAIKRVVVIGAIDKDPRRGYAHIRIRDTGGGIAVDDLHRIFIPFFTTKSRGYGIGLAIVQKIVVAHGGDVTVERSNTAGTVFHCRLPLSPPSMDMENELQDV